MIRIPTAAEQLKARYIEGGIVTWKDVGGDTIA
jgi:hypothetical protein